MWPAQHHFEIIGFEAADALFVSALQCSQAPSTDQVRQAIDAAVRAFGYSGCAGRVAQEFGDHPETAAVRMRWARAAVAILEGQSVPGTRRMSAADGSVSGGNAATKLPAIRSA
jgi:hypothetical protein